MSDTLTSDEIRSRIQEIKTLRFGDVLAHPRNPKVHPDSQRAAFRGAVRDIGFVSVPLAYYSERNGGALTWADGHLRGSEVADYTGEVAILDIDDAEADYLLVTADPIASMAQTDAAALDDLLRDVQTGSAAVMDMLAGLAESAGLYEEPTVGAGGDEFDATPQEGETRARRGDIWQLGEHRLLVGDCTIAENVARLMGGEKAAAVVTDPPYGMHLDADYSKMSGNGRKGRKWENVIGDDNDFDPVPIMQMFDYCAEQFWWGADYYAERIPNKNKGSWLVWDKTLESNGDAGYASEFELCWSKQPHRREILRFNWFRFFGLQQQDIGERLHPTQKPLQVIAPIIEQHTQEGATVFDPFLGSGTTLIAAERLGRKCYGCEIEPRYADVIIRRFEAESGETAQLVERVND